MRTEYRKKFMKDLARLPSEERTRIEKFVFEEVLKLNSIFESGKFEQMKGYPAYFKVRFGFYRVGVKLENKIVVFERVLHRKEIYRYFP